MGNLGERQRKKKLIELLSAAGIIPGGAALPDHTSQAEDVSYFLGEEGEVRVAPSDTRCMAVNKRTKDGRCKKEVWYNEELDSWSVLCEMHQAQNDKARFNEAKIVKLFEA